MKDIPGWEGKYAVTKDGRVWSYPKNKNNLKHNGKWLALCTMDDGYYNVVFIDGAKRVNKRVHRLVAEVFIPNPENKPQVNHKNGMKTDNGVENLEWCTGRENCLHAIKTNLYTPAHGSKHVCAKLTEEKVAQIKRLFKNGCRQKDIMTLMDVSSSQVHSIVRGKTWKRVL